jgi:hypothetical protein
MATGLPDRATALAAPLRAFPSWHIRIECAACGRDRCLAETNLTIAGHGDRRVGDLIRRLKHEGCGGRPKLVELITGIPGGARGSGASCCWSETAPREAPRTRPLSRGVGGDGMAALVGWLARQYTMPRPTPLGRNLTTPVEAGHNRWF